MEEIIKWALLNGWMNKCFEVGGIIISDKRMDWLSEEGEEGGVALRLFCSASSFF